VGAAPWQCQSPAAVPYTIGATARLGGTGRATSARNVRATQVSWPARLAR
jgi:hypothetical protein